MDEMLATLLSAIPGCSVLTPYVRKDKLFIPIYFHREVKTEDCEYLSDISRIFGIIFIVAKEELKNNVSIRRIECF